MPMDPLRARARALWMDLAGAPVSFPPRGEVTVVASPHSGLCPAGWVGVVALGGSAIVTVPGEGAAGPVREALAGLPVAAVVDGVSVGEVLPVARVLGPAALAYVSPEGFRSARPGTVRWAAGRGGSGAAPFPSGLLPNPSCDVNRNG
ncbi:hypothetical protein ACIBTS_38240, partial [Streptomyces sp. NPDC050121]